MNVHHYSIILATTSFENIWPLYRARKTVRIRTLRSKYLEGNSSIFIVRQENRQTYKYFVSKQVEFNSSIGKLVVVVKGKYVECGSEQCLKSERFSGSSSSNVPMLRMALLALLGAQYSRLLLFEEKRVRGRNFTLKTSTDQQRKVKTEI